MYSLTYMASSATVNCSIGQCLIDIPQNIVQRFQTNGDANHIRGNPGRALLCFAELSVGGRCGVDHQGFGIAYIGQMAEELAALDKFNPACCPLLSRMPSQR